MPATTACSGQYVAEHECAVFDGEHLRISGVLQRFGDRAVVQARRGRDARASRTGGRGARPHTPRCGPLRQATPVGRPRRRVKNDGTPGAARASSTRNGTPSAVACTRSITSEVASGAEARTMASTCPASSRDERQVGAGTAGAQPFDEFGGGSGRGDTGRRHAEPPRHRLRCRRNTRGSPTCPRLPSEGPPAPRVRRQAPPAGLAAAARPHRASPASQVPRRRRLTPW